MPHKSLRKKYLSLY